LQAFSIDHASFYIKTLKEEIPIDYLC